MQFAGELFNQQGHLGAAVAGSHPTLLHKPVMRVEGACASGGLAFACAVDAIRAGADVGLVVGAEVQTTVSARQGGEVMAWTHPTPSLPRSLAHSHLLIFFSISWFVVKKDL